MNINQIGGSYDLPITKEIAQLNNINIINDNKIFISCHGSIDTSTYWIVPENTYIINTTRLGRPTQYPTNSAYKVINDCHPGYKNLNEILFNTEIQREKIDIGEQGITLSGHAIYKPGEIIPLVSTSFTSLFYSSKKDYKPFRFTNGIYNLPLVDCSHEYSDAKILDETYTLRLINFLIFNKTDIDVGEHYSELGIAALKFHTRMKIHFLLMRCLEKYNFNEFINLYNKVAPIYSEDIINGLSNYIDICECLKILSDDIQEKKLFEIFLLSFYYETSFLPDIKIEKLDNTLNIIVALSFEPDHDDLSDDIRNIYLKIKERVKGTEKNNEYIYIINISKIKNKVIL